MILNPLDMMEIHGLDPYWLAIMWAKTHQCDAPSDRHSYETNKNFKRNVYTLSGCRDKRSELSSAKGKGRESSGRQMSEKWVGHNGLMVQYFLFPLSALRSWGCCHG